MTTTTASEDDGQTTEEYESGSDGEESDGEVASANGSTYDTTRNLLVPGDGTSGGGESAQADGDGDGGGSNSSSEDRTIYMIIAGLAAVAILVALLTWRYWLLTRPGLDLDDDDEAGGYGDGGPPAYPEGPADRGGMGSRPDDRATMANPTGWASPAPAPPGPPGPPATAPGTAMAPALDNPYGGDSYSADPYATAPHSPFDDESPFGADPATASTALPAHHMAGAADPQATSGLQMPGPIEGAAGPRTALGDALGGVAAAGSDRRSARGRDRESAEPGVPAPPGDRRRRRDRAGLEPDDGRRVRRPAANGPGRPDGDPRRTAGAPDQGRPGSGAAGAMPGRRRRRGADDDMARPEEPAPRRGRGARSGRGARAEEGRRPKPPKERRRRDSRGANDPFGWDAVTDASAFGLEQQERSERGGRRQGPTIGDTDGWGRSTRRR